MVGCKDDPRHKLRHLPSLQLKSPTQDEQNIRVAHWLHTVTPTLSIPPHTSTFASNKVKDHHAPDTLSTARPHPSKQSQFPTRARSQKCKALAQLEPFRPRKSARLAQKQSGSGYNMSTSTSKRKIAGKNAREGAKRGPADDQAKASGGCVVTRTQAQAKASLAGSSDKENPGAARDVVPTNSETEDAGITIPLLQRIAVLPPPDLRSPPKRKDPASRPSSPTKSTSTRSGKAPVLVDKRERLTFLNPPVKFFTPAHLSKLGKSIQPLVRSLWVEYITSCDEGYIPKALEVGCISSSTGIGTNSLYQSRQECLRRLQINQNRVFPNPVLQKTPDTLQATMKGYG